jgi:hypothetical protein
MQAPFLYPFPDALYSFFDSRRVDFDSRRPDFNSQRVDFDSQSIDNREKPVKPCSERKPESNLPAFNAVLRKSKKHSLSHGSKQ